MKHAPFLKLLSGAALALALVASPAIARDRHGDQDKDAKQQPLYPNATREEPKLDLTSEKEQKTLNEGLQAANAQDKAKATQLLQPIIDNSKSKYAKALALQGLASLHYNEGDIKGALDLLKRALDIGVMPNDTYFQLELRLASFYLADKQYQQAIDTIAKWRAGTKAEDVNAYAIEGNAYYQLQKYPEAIAALKKAQAMSGGKPNPNVDQVLLAAYADSGQTDQAAQLAQQQLAANPNDPAARSNAIATMVQSGNYAQAITLEEKAKASGSFDEKDYVMLAKLHMMLAQQGTDSKANATKAAAVLDEGMSKGIVKPSAETYTLLGAAAYSADNTSKAIDAYRKAIPLASDGEPAIYAGKLLLNEGKFSQAKSLLSQGIAKGVKRQGAAYMALAQAERGLKNKPAAIAAMKKAAQDPDTAAKAKDWLKKAGAG